MFKKAERSKSKLRLGLVGPSGSGKTFSALRIAYGLGGKVAMIDTERSGNLYSDRFEYDIADLQEPYSPERYIHHIQLAEKSGYDVLIIDSLSHAWAGTGGVLDMKDKASSGSSDSFFSGWRVVTPKHNALVDKLLSCNMHLIATMRAKSAYEMEQYTDNQGKKKTKPVKIGLAPVQREGLDYEFTVVFDMSVQDHIASTSKDRTSLFDGQFFTPDETTGEKLLEWLNTGIDYAAIAAELEKGMKEAKTDAELEKFVEDNNYKFKDNPNRKKLVEAYRARKEEFKS